MTNGAGFILLINLAVGGLLAAAFLAVATYDRSRLSARWLAAAYAVGIAYYIIEASIPWFRDSRPVVVLAFAVFLSAMALFNAGLAQHYRVRVPWKWLGVAFLVSTVCVALVQELPRHAFARMVAYQMPYFLMQAMAIGIISSARTRTTLDRAFAMLLGASALQFAAKPFIAHALGGWGRDPQAYLGSTYAMVSQTLGTIFGLAVALMALVILGRELLAELAAKSETDSLSGLFNRRGFQQRAARALAPEPGMPLLPVSVVIADLDRFKSINDRYGHAGGDRVIEAFAGFLRRSLSERDIAGRIGGEEFAVLLPGATLASARLFAEGARSAFAGMPVRGLPDAIRFTASFGVAEWQEGETIQDLMLRADEALYAAKNGGRDCVRAAQPRAARNVVTMAAG